MSGRAPHRPGGAPSAALGRRPRRRRTCVEIKHWAPHAVDAMLSSYPNSLVDFTQRQTRPRTARAGGTSSYAIDRGCMYCHAISALFASDASTPRLGRAVVPNRRAGRLPSIKHPEQVDGSFFAARSRSDLTAGSLTRSRNDPRLKPSNNKVQATLPQNDGIYRWWWIIRPPQSTAPTSAATAMEQKETRPHHQQRRRRRKQVFDR